MRNVNTKVITPVIKSAHPIIIVHRSILVFLNKSKRDGVSAVCNRNVLCYT